MRVLREDFRVWLVDRLSGCEKSGLRWWKVRLGAAGLKTDVVGFAAGTALKVLKE